MAFAVEATPNPGTISVNPTSIIVYALLAGIAYYFLRSISSNKFVVIAIGIALTLFTSGTLQLIGEGVLALGVSRLMEEEINKIESSS